jgi:hypothetical protein
MPDLLDLKQWLIDRCAEYTLDVTAVFHRLGKHEWPLELTVADGASRCSRPTAIPT